MTQNKNCSIYQSISTLEATFEIMQFYPEVCLAQVSVVLAPAVYWIFASAALSVPLPLKILGPDVASASAWCIVSLAMLRWAGQDTSV